MIKARKLSSAMSAAKAACDHMRDWFVGTGVNFFCLFGLPGCANAIIRYIDLS